MAARLTVSASIAMILEPPLPLVAQLAAASGKVVWNINMLKARHFE